MANGKTASWLQSEDSHEAGKTSTGDADRVLVGSTSGLGTGPGARSGGGSRTFSNISMVKRVPVSNLRNVPADALE